MNPRKFVKPFVLILIIAAFVLLSRYFHLGYRIDIFRQWISSLGAWGAAVYVIVYALAVTALFPASVLTIAAGAMFGSLLGVILVSIASTLGAALSFILARYFVRDFVKGVVEKQEKLKRLDRLVEIHGNIIVAITRLIPLFPYTLLNYAFGITRISFSTYIFWSWLCMLPGTALYVVGADAVFKTAESGKIPWTLAGIFCAALLLIVLLLRIARNTLVSKQK
jgi:uncharacterized membrane protein YdjX (TVP38/TMEM64 family)